VGQLVLIRHGESEGNRERRFTRTPEVPLTPEGLEQARAAARWIASRFAPVRIVSSPFRRALQTSAALAETLGLPIDVEPELREMSYGDLAGQPYEVGRGIRGVSPYWDWRPPNGETLVEVLARAGAALDRLAAATPDDDIVVVSHGGVMRALWRHVTGDWQSGSVVRNAGIVLVEHSRGTYVNARLVEEA
jgi:probable phosphoglycerate mutase